VAFENAVIWPKRVAALWLPQAYGFSIARTQPEVDGHYTVWGDAELLLGNVERVDTREEPGKLGAER
jgi:hypothetical protein